MRLSLRLHPDSRCAAVTRIEVEIAPPSAGVLPLSYIVSGKISDVRMPALTAPTRGDELWRHTCFEAFVGASSGGGYYEFNFAPSMQWAAYRFSGYRSHMSVADEVGAPSIETAAKPDVWTLKAKLDLGRLTALQGAAPQRLGLCAVIEDIEGNMAYWALSHPPGKPDFHHPDCFAHEFSAAAQS